MWETFSADSPQNVAFCSRLRHRVHRPRHRLPRHHPCRRHPARLRPFQDLHRRLRPRRRHPLRRRHTPPWDRSRWPTCKPTLATTSAPLDTPCTMTTQRDKPRTGCSLPRSLPSTTPCHSIGARTRHRRKPTNGRMHSSRDLTHLIWAAASPPPFPPRHQTPPTLGRTTCASPTPSLRANQRRALPTTCSLQRCRATITLRFDTSGESLTPLANRGFSRAEMSHRRRRLRSRHHRHRLRPRRHLRPHHPHHPHPRHRRRRRHRHRLRRHRHLRRPRHRRPRHRFHYFTTNARPRREHPEALRAAQTAAIRTMPVTRWNR